MRIIKFFSGRFISRFAKPLLPLSILFLISCGGGLGGILAALQYVPAIGGDFCLAPNGSGAPLDQFGNCESLFPNIAIDNQGTVVWDGFYDSKLGVSGFVTVADPAINNPFTCSNFMGLTDQQEITAYNNDNFSIPSPDMINPAVDTVCFRGTFVNLNLLRLSSGEELLRNAVPLLTEGVWMNVDNANHVFKFEIQGTDNFTGCEINNGVITLIDGTYQPSDVANRVFTDFQELRILRSAGIEVWQGDFVGVSGIELTQSSGSLIRLQRQPDDNNVFKCN